MKDSRVKLRIQVWILAAALSLSPLLAQDPPQPKLNNETHQRLDNSLVGTSILSVLPARRAAAADLQDKAAANRTQAASPGRTYGTVFGILILAGGVVAASLAFSGKGRKQSIQTVGPVGPVGTVVTAGTPTINPPSNQ